MNKQKIKCLLVLATVVIIVKLVYWGNVTTDEFGAKLPTAGNLQKRKSDHGNTSHVYQKNTTCPVLSIERQRSYDDDTKYSEQCKPWLLTEEVCGTAAKFYSIKKDVSCEGNPGNSSQIICRLGFGKLSKHTSRDKALRAHCNEKICKGGRLLVGSLNPTTGIVTSEDWEEFRSARSAELALPKIVLNNKRGGLSFCLIRCIKNSENIDQLLTFPKLLQRHRENLHKNDELKFGVKRKAKVRDKLFTINIVVLDSVSRNHFYRMLPKTVNMLRQTVSASTTRVLDYEFLQSLAPYTSTNIKALFSGSIERESHKHLNQNIGIQTLYGHFKRHDYRTLFQEDSCWYDHWGTVLGDNARKEKRPQTMEDFKKSWRIFRNITKGYPIDDYGLTHFSCVVFKMHGNLTNMFNKPLKVCYNGRPFSSYFLRYAGNFLSNSRKDKVPAFSYLHTNIGHEVTGLRIKALDNELSAFVGDVASQKDTLTILLSDHGPKTTTYSQDYLHGRYETYDSLLFMIIPKNVQHGLGVTRMSTLVRNQKSLVTMQDVHEMLTEMTQLDKRKKTTSLFSDHISNRTCDSLPMVNYGVCKCKDWEQIFIDQSPQFIKLAEFATEKLNNKIREQFSKSNQSGFGKCRKLQLYRIWNIRQRVSKDKNIVTFDLVVQPFGTVFLVQTKHTEKNDKIKSVELHSWRRVSLYRHYRKCKDKTVDIELCVCNMRTWYSNKKLVRMIEKAKSRKENEIINTRTSCLYILLTKVETDPRWIFSYDVVNICARQYIFTASIFDNSENLPHNEVVRDVLPNTKTFLLSVFVKGEKKPNLSYNFRRNANVGQPM